MNPFDVLFNWVHVLAAVVFLGGMFVATFALMPTLKAELDYEHRHRFVVAFIPRVRSIMRIVVASLVVTGLARAALLHFSAEGPPGTLRMSVFGAKMLFAAVPVAIFLLAPRILGKRSPEGLCCDPDAEGPPIAWAATATGVMTTMGAGLHYAAIAGGWLAVLCGVLLAHMR